ncbi:S-adenosylmethionine:tRNA ribosyltransferase-isomerase [Bacillus cereus]|uniref:S-adenosylmethionine:tRNA ribosyltransferase-isomerase n=1 Tax=Bacillus sp. BB56-3 TaxID=2217831 RepID=UPI0015D29547|nr:S-adenosylmethionine:tRNA ribosyltransferase-isomerase [Bacillus sp. BB56-3]MCU4759619.1 S-adenosylmethionine:tRNA ribosyltransferase-isomerase [Bacillus cereus]
MKVEDLDFKLPAHLFARKPRELNGQHRNDSKMLVIKRETKEFTDDNFKNIINYLQKGDLVILNNSKTINAVFRGRDFESKRIADITLCREIDEKVWLASIQNENNILYNVNFIVSNELSFTILKKSDRIPGYYEIKLNFQGDLLDISDKYGRPIISNYTEKPWDIEYYRNEYSTKPGSVELPAAGRHFTQEIITKLKENGIGVEYITLHTGLSSLEIESDNLADHRMYEEWFSISKDVADKINQTKKMGNKVIAVGTTVTRTLESSVDNDGQVKAGENLTDLYIYPGFKFKVIDALITNFHGPRSSRIALAAAFSNIDTIMDAYEFAIQNEYLFYEFGDTTFII